MAEVEGPKSFTATSRDIARRVSRHEIFVLVAVLIAAIAGMAGATRGTTLQLDNAMNVLLHTATRGLASIGQAFVILTGGIDLSVGGVGLFCALLGSVLMTSGESNIIGQPLSIYAGIPIMLAVGASFGVFNGSLVSRVGVPALIVTLGLWQITNGASFLVSDGLAVGGLPGNLAFYGSGDIAGVPVPVIIFIVVAVIAYFFLSHTSFGGSVYAAGGNPASAWLSGIDVKRIRLVVYIISGFLAGLAGVVMTARTMSSSMETLAGLELDSIAAACLGGVSLSGGMGTLVGVVIGAIIIGVTNNGLIVLNVNPALRSIVKGLIIFAAVAADCIRRRR